MNKEEETEEGRRWQKFTSRKSCQLSTAYKRDSSSESGKCSSMNNKLLV